MNTSYQTGTTSRTAVYLLGRVVQLLCIAGFIYGCYRLPELVTTLKNWQRGTATITQLFTDILQVSLPCWLAISLFVYSEISLRHDRYAIQSLDEKPNEPWLANPHWSTPRLRATDTVPWRVFVFTALSVVLIGVPLAGIFTSDHVVLGILLILAILTFSFAISRRLSKDWRNSELQLMTFPASIGGPCAALFTIRRDFSTDTLFTATLQCTYLLPYSSTDESDNTRRIFWSKTIEINNVHSPQTGVTQLPLQFSIPNNCPESTVVPTGSESMRDVRWELMVQRKEAAESGIARFMIPVFRTKNSGTAHELSAEFLRDVTPTHDAHLLLKEVDFSETSLGDDRVTMTFRLRSKKVLKLASSLFMLCVAGILAIFLIIPNLLLQVFLSFLPLMIIVAILINIGEYWLWRGKIVRDRDELLFDCGIPFVYSPIRALANAETKLSCEVAFQSQTQVHESWNLFINANGEKRLLFRQLGSQGEVEAVQRWLADRLGIGILELENRRASTTADSPPKPPRQPSRPKSKKSKRK